LRNLIIYQKVYDLILYLFPILNRFPKTQKFVLAQQIENSILEIAKLITQANLERDKRSSLTKIDIELEKLRLLIRLAKDLRFINVKRYEYVSKMVNEVGRLLGGWIRKFSQG